MANKTVQSVKNSLKFKATPRGGLISVRVGVKKYVVPVEARLIAGDGYLFLSFPAVSELFKVGGKTLTAMSSKDNANDAYEKLNPRSKGRRRRSSVEMPSQLADALKNLPAGYRLGYSPDGTPKLVKTRKRGARRNTRKAKA